MFYDKMKAKYVNDIRERNYFDQLLISLCSMFEWTLPEGVSERYLEMWLHVFGSVGVQKSGDQYYLCPTPSRVGNLDQYGDGETVEGAVLNSSYTIRGQFGEDAFICYNNKARASDKDLYLYSGYFASVDKAIKINTALSGLAPILSSNNTTTSTAIEQIMTRLLDGEVKVVTSENILQALQVGDNNPLYSIDITNPERIRNVQYQSMLYDNLLRRFYNKYGLNIRTTNKAAQVNTDEVNGMDCVSWVLPLDMLKARRDFCDAISSKTGDTWSVDFAEPWKQEYESYNIRNMQIDAEREVQADGNTAEIPGTETGQGSTGTV